MKATEALYEGLFPKPYKVILIFKSGYEIRGMTYHGKATVWYFHEVLFIMQQKVDVRLTLESVDKSLMCDHSHRSLRKVFQRKL